MASRAAVLNRLRAVIELAADRVAPRGWSDLSVTEQLLVDSRDPELAAVLKGQMPAELELQVMSGKWADEAPAVKSTEQLREEAAAQAFAAMGPLKGVEQLEREQQERLAMQASSARNSYVQSYGRWGQG